ncbi:hypothetical protein B0H67DRAFT_248443 [Lasiosphaeris hirsuta]|uniref:Uncharacterized protein n=1 Tax=Lasiosphaeris hirsuta TaxID=260670 RepID=A0AA40AH30_9PEZI|nr:hypothetical protein B0H67DRAFT_248443 [Lasiosphaeris hirsuta]
MFEYPEISPGRHHHRHSHLPRWPPWISHGHNDRQLSTVDHRHSIANSTPLFHERNTSTITTGVATRTADTTRPENPIIHHKKKKNTRYMIIIIINHPNSLHLHPQHINTKDDAAHQLASPQARLAVSNHPPPLSVDWSEQTETLLSTQERGRAGQRGGGMSPHMYIYLLHGGHSLNTKQSRHNQHGTSSPPHRFSFTPAIFI